MNFRSTVILGGKTATGVEVPPEVVARLGEGRKRLPVIARIGSYHYRTKIAPMGGAFLIPLAANTARRSAPPPATRSRSTWNRTPRRARRAASRPGRRTGRRPGALAGFDALSYSNQRRVVLRVEGARSDATRQRRTSKAVADLARG